MRVQSRIWNVSVRSQNDQRVKAANVKEDGGSLIFTDTQGDLVGNFNLTQVQGYSVEPKQEITVVVRSVLDASVIDAPPVSKDKLWNVLLPSKKKHRFEAASVKEHEGSLVFTDMQGDLAGKFYVREVQGYSVEPEASKETARIKVEDRLSKVPLPAVMSGSREKG